MVTVYPTPYVQVSEAPGYVEAKYGPQSSSGRNSDEESIRQDGTGPSSLLTTLIEDQLIQVSQTNEFGQGSSGNQR